MSSVPFALKRSTSIPSVPVPVESVALPTTTIWPFGWIATPRPIEPVPKELTIGGPVTTPPPNELSSPPAVVSRATMSVAAELTPLSPTTTTLPSLWTASPSTRVLLARLAIPPLPKLESSAPGDAARAVALTPANSASVAANVIVSRVNVPSFVVARLSACKIPCLPHR